VVTIEDLIPPLLGMSPFIWNFLKQQTYEFNLSVGDLSINISNQTKNVKGKKRQKK
jgi:hypothetical protein